MVLNLERPGEESFQHVKSLRDIIDYVMFASACCRSNQDVVKLLTSGSVVIESEVLERLEIFATVLRGYIEGCSTLGNRIRNTIGLVGFACESNALRRWYLRLIESKTG